MKEYHKIESVFVRDEKTHKFIDGSWRTPEFEYLRGVEWVGEEKIDGTNVRVMWDGAQVRLGGRTDNAQMYVPLLDRLRLLFPDEKMREVFPVDEHGSNPGVCLYGEGYGARIQKGGGNYLANEVDFVVFDVRIGEWWLRRADVHDIAVRLGVRTAPEVFFGTLAEAVDIVRRGLKSTWGDFPAEGMVLRPMVDLFGRNGERIITKVKTKDFA